jgi:hypothetical protein
VTIRDAVAARDHDSARARRELAAGLTKLADAHRAAGSRSEARDAVVRATDLFIALAKADPDSGQAQRDLALAYGRWGQVLAGSHPTGALVVWLNSLDRFQKLGALDSGNSQAKADEALAWERLAGCYASHGLTDRARAAAKKALALWVGLGDAAGGKTKAGRRRLALAMLRCGDIDVEARQLADARAWYKKAQAEVESLVTDAAYGPVAARVADQLLYLDAVEAGVGNPTAVLDFPGRVRVPALRAVVELELRAGHPVNASAAADQLAKLAATADELFVAARTFALCLAVCRGDKEEKESRAADVVARLEKAIDLGFRDPALLTGPEWDAVARHSPEFARLVEKLEKLR